MTRINYDELEGDRKFDGNTYEFSTDEQDPNDDATSRERLELLRSSFNEMIDSALTNPSAVAGIMFSAVSKPNQGVFTSPAGEDAEAMSGGWGDDAGLLLATMTFARGMAER